MATPLIKAVLVLDQNNAARVHAKYFTAELNTPEKQLAFEKKLFSKATAGLFETEVLLLERNLAVYQSGTDVMFFVVAGENENELILVAVLEAIVETLRTVLRGHLDKNTILDNLELLLLTVDEIVDAGSILETDTTVLARRVMLRNPDAGAAPGGLGGLGSGANIPVVPANIGELSLTGALNAAREQLVRLSRA